MAEAEHLDGRGLIMDPIEMAFGSRAGCWLIGWWPGIAVWRFAAAMAGLDWPD